jgi:hypothetical protein
MTTEFRGALAGLCGCAVLICGAQTVGAAGTEEARITALARDVTFVSARGDTKPVALNDHLRSVTTVRTGADSHAEITFGNQTIARLWSKSVLGVNNGARDLQLREGVAFLQVPRGVKARIRAGEVAAALSGTTMMLEYRSTVFKFLMLEGIGRLYRPGHFGDSILVHPGQMVIGNPQNALSDPVDFDIGRFVKTSRFILDFPPLPSQSLMIAASEEQQREKSKKVLIDTNLVIFGGGTLVSIVDPSVDPAREQQANESPAVGNARRQ